MARGPELLSSKPIVAILALAALVRIGVVAWNSPFPPLDDDAAVYSRLAWNLLQGHGFSKDSEPPYEPLAVRTPGYPGFVAAVFAVAGRRPEAVRVAQIGLSLLTCGFVYLAGRRVLSTRGALAATGIYALLPAAVLFPAAVLTEANQALLVALAVYLALRCADAPGNTKWYLACAATVAYAALCKPEYQLLLFCFLGALFFVRQSWKAWLIRSALAVACLVLLLTPWVVRNYVVFDRFIGLSTGGGHGFVAARLMAEGKQGAELQAALEERYGKLFREKYGREMTYVDGALPDQDALRRQDFVDFVRSEPLTYARHSLARVVGLWAPRSWSGVVGLRRDFSEYRREGNYARLAGKAGLLIVDAVVMGLALVGFLFALPSWRRFAPILVILLYLSGIYGLVYSTARYRVPALPVVAILAVYGVTRLVGLARPGAANCVAEG